MNRSTSLGLGMQRQTAAPLTGSTVVMTDDAFDRNLVLNPAGTLAVLTVTLPTEANSRLEVAANTWQRLQ